MPLAAFQLDDEWEAPSYAWRDKLAQMRTDGEQHLERETCNWASLDWDADDPVVPDLTLSDDADVFAVDSMLYAARCFSQAVTGLLIRNLGRAQRIGIDRVLEFRTIEHYGKERLGMSERSVRGLLRLRRGLLRLPAVEEAYATGVLTQCQAEQVVRVAQPATTHAWVDYARQTTVRKLKKVVAFALSTPKPHPDLWPPEVRQTYASAEAQDLLEATLAKTSDASDRPLDDVDTETRQTCAPPDAVRVPDDPDLLASPGPVTVRFRLPRDLEVFIQQGLGLCRLKLKDGLGMASELPSDRPAGLSQMSPDMPSGQAPRPTLARCVELLVDTFIVQYLHEARAAAQEHPVPERDNWTCQVPGCTNKIRLQVHHLKFRSQGGSLKDWNESTVCVAHHLEGIHAGRMVAKGMAPDDIVWVVGIRPDGSPSQVFLGDHLVYSANP